jgi:hypothetical protein
MKRYPLVLVLLLHFSSLYSQDTINEMEYTQEVRRQLNQSRSIKNLNSKRSECEIIVKELVKKEKDTEVLKEQYNQTADAFNEYIEMRISDISEIESYGGFVESIFLTKNRKNKYDKMLNIANQKQLTFLNNARDSLSIDSGIISLFVDSFISIFPKVSGAVSGVENIALSRTKEIIIEKLEVARFRTWDEIIFPE